MLYVKALAQDADRERGVSDSCQGVVLVFGGFGEVLSNSSSQVTKG
jgi:hypothetical protein